MGKTTKLALVAAAAALSFFLVARPIGDFIFQHPLPPAQTQQGQLRDGRLHLMKPDALANLIAPKPGSVVLDVGAGYGMLTFPLALIVKDSGKVFATDTDPHVINYLESKVKDIGAKNIVPVRVRSDGVDEFYLSQQFDTIVASDIIAFLHDPRDFFIQIASRLEPRNGRLWIIDLRLDPDFTTEEIQEPTVLARLSKLMSEGSPFLRHIDPTSLADQEAGLERLTRNLNELLDSSSLFEEAQAEHWPLREEQAEIRTALVRVVRQVKESTDGSRRRALRLLNRLVIQDVLDVHLWERSFNLDTLNPKQWTPLLRQLSRGQDYPRLLEDTDLDLVEVYNVAPYDYIFEFRRHN
jgi:SAM-dependent methyltransferase